MERMKIVKLLLNLPRISVSKLVWWGFINLVYAITIMVLLLVAK